MVLDKQTATKLVDAINSCALPSETNITVQDLMKEDVKNVLINVAIDLLIEHAKLTDDGSLYVEVAQAAGYDVKL